MKAPRTPETSTDPVALAGEQLADIQGARFRKYAGAAALGVGMVVLAESNDGDGEGAHYVSPF
jgi:hypothetical protein